MIYVNKSYIKYWYDSKKEKFRQFSCETIKLIQLLKLIVNAVYFATKSGQIIIIHFHCYYYSIFIIYNFDYVVVFNI